MFDEFDDEEEMLNKIQHYLDIGAIRIAGFASDGEAIFELNEETTRKLAPDLWEAHEQYIDAELLDLMDNDLMQVEYDEELNATFNFTLEGYEIAKRKGIVPIDSIEDFDI
jgi:beta-galactosidase beta subunit